MTLLEIVYLISFLITWWSYLGYLIALYIFSKLSIENVGKEKFEKITMIIPTFNEEKNILKKLKNSIKISYNNLEIMVADGGSNDKTVSIVKSFVRKHKNIKLLPSFERLGKIHDVNKALKIAIGEIIVITDADSVLPKNVIKKILDGMRENIGTVGICTVPNESTGLPSEFDYWITSNKIRFLESKVGSTSTVIAPCYAFRKNIIKQFPKNVIADDLYATLRTVELGYKAIYAKDSVVHEMRTPMNKRIMLVQKFRKSIAVLREYRRFGSKLFGFSFFKGLIYPTRMLQFFITPFILIVFLILSVYFAFYNFIQFLTFTILFVVSILIANLIMAKVQHPHFKKMIKLNFLQKIIDILLLNLIIILSLLTYLFIKKSSRYKRI